MAEMSRQQPRAQPQDGVTTAAAIKSLENKVEADRHHVDQKLQRLQKRVEEVASAIGARGHWAETQGQVDFISETVQDLVRRLDINLPADRGRVVDTTPPRDDAISADSPATSHLAERITALEAWTHSYAAKQEAELTRRSVNDGLELQSYCDRQMEELRAEIARQTSALTDKFAELDQRVARSERDFLEAATHFNQVDVSRTTSALPAAEEGTAVVPAIGFGGSCANGGVLMREGESAGDSDVQDFRVADLEDVSEGMHQQLMYLSSRFVSVERTLKDLEQCMHDLRMDQTVRQQVDQVGEQMMKLALLRAEVAHDPSAPYHGAVKELQSEVSAISEDVTSVQTQVRLLEACLEKMSKAFTRVCEELAVLRRKSQRGGGSPAGCSVRSGDSEAETLQT